MTNQEIINLEVRADDKEAAKLLKAVENLNKGLSTLNSKITNLSINYDKLTLASKQLEKMKKELESLKQIRLQAFADNFNEISEDVQKAKENLKEFTQKIKDLKKERIELLSGKGFEKDREKLKELQNQIQSTEQALKKLSEEGKISGSKKLKKEFDTLQESVKNFEAEAKSIEIKIADSSKERLEEIKEELKDFNKQAKEARETKKIDIGVAAKSMENVTKLNDKIETLTDKIKAKEISHATLQIKTDEAEQSIVNLTNTLMTADNKVSDMKKSFKENLNLKDSITNINAMESALSSLSPMVSVLEGIGQAMTGLAASAIEEAKEWEMLRIKLGTFYSSVSEATEEFNYLVEMAKTTPFEIKGLVQSAVMLRAFGHDMRETIQLTGDLAAALGGDVKDASYAVSRALSGASMGFLMLQRTWGISYAKLKALGAEFMSGNKLIAGSIKTQKALLLALQEHHGAMERQSATAAGKLSNLKDAIDTLKESIGQAALPAIKKGVDTATWLVNTIASLPQEIKVAAISIAGLTGGLLLLVSAGYKAVNTLIAVRLAMLNFQASVGGQALLSGLTKFTPTFMGIAAGAGKATSSIATMVTTSIAGFASMNLAANTTIMTLGILGGAIAGIGVIIAAIAGAGWYLEWKKTQKIMAEVTEETELLRGGLTELRNQYPETFSLEKIFRAELAKTAEQLAENTDKTYKYKGSMKNLYGETEEDFIAQNNILIQAMKDRKEIASRVYEDMLKEKEQFEKEHMVTKITGGSISGKTETMFDYDMLEEKDKEYYSHFNDLVDEAYERVNKLTNNIEKQTKTFEEALTIRQMRQGQYEEQLTKLSKAEAMESLDENALQQQKEALERLLQMTDINENDLIDLKVKYANVEKKINDKKIADEKRVIDARKDAWKDFTDSQQIALDKGDISHKQYVANLKQYLVDHQNELLTDADTRVAIEKEIASEEEKLHKELVDDKIKMDDDYISAKFGADEAAYVKSVATLNKQREDYIQHGNDKVAVDKWYYAQKEQLDYEYYIKQKQNMLKFQEDLAKSQTRKGSFAEERASADADMEKQLLDLEILAKEYEKQNFKKADIDRMVSGERLRIETEHAEKMQDILMKEQQFYEEMYREVLQHYLDMGQLTEAEYLRMQQSILEESVKRHEEAAKVIEKNILAGGEISQQEAEIYKLYTKETKELREINKQLDTKLDSTGKIFETEMDILKQELELKKLRGEISEDTANLTILKYRKDFLDVHKQDYELLKQKRAEGKELTADEVERYKTYQSLSIEQEQELNTLQKTVSTTDKLTTSTQKATTAAKDLGTSMEKVADNTEKATEEMKSYGSMMENLGPTMTPEQALGNLPGATSPMSAPTISGRYTTPDYSINQLRGGARAGGEWDTFFKDMYTELGEQTKTENRRNFEEEMEEKRNHWKREFEAVDLNVRGMNESTSAAMDSMSADINRFSNTPVNVTVNVSESGGGGGEGPAGGGPGPLSTPDGQVTSGGEGTTGGGHQGGRTVGADYSSINTGGVGAQSGWSGVNNPFDVPDSYEYIPGTGNYYITPEGEVTSYDPTSEANLQAVVDAYDTNQNLYNPRKRETGLNLDLTAGFDNPSHDKIAEKLGEKQAQSVLSVIQKNTEDIVKNFLAGTVSAVKQSYNNITNNSKAETRNYYNNKKYSSSAYNISIDNASPVKRVPMRVRNGIEGITDFALKSRFSGGRL